MSSKAIPDELVFERVGESLAFDLLTDVYSDEEIHESIQRLGGDPVAIEARGRDLAARFLRERRLDWMKDADARSECVRHALQDSVPEAETMNKGALMNALLAMRAHPAAGGAVRTAFRKRRPEESSEEELRALYREAVRLQRLAGSGTKDPER